MKITSYWYKLYLRMLKSMEINCLKNKNQKNKKLKCITVAIVGNICGELSFAILFANYQKSQKLILKKNSAT